MTREAKPVKVAIKKLLTESSLEVGGGGDRECIIIIILRPGRGAECGERLVCVQLNPTVTREIKILQKLKAHRHIITLREVVTSKASIFERTWPVSAASGGSEGGRRC